MTVHMKQRCGNCKYSAFPEKPKGKRTLLHEHGKCEWPMPALPPMAYSIMPMPQDRYGIWIDTGEMCPVWEAR